MPYKHIEVRPISGALGAEIHNVTLSQKLSEEVFSEIHHAWMTHLVVFFRNQDLTPDQHIAFSKRFGELLEVPFVRALPDYPQILPVMKGASEKKKRVFGGIWHTDMSYTAEPPMASALYGRVLPPFGGDTLWANMYLAYDTLSEGMKAFLDQLVVVHSAVKSYGAYGIAVNNGDPAHKMAVTSDERAYQEQEHPAVRIHPVTKKKAIYINSAYSIRFKDFSEEESAPILQYLFTHITRPEFTCRFRWDKGSLALWDNRCTQHLPLNDYDGFDRELYRTTIAGDRPIPVSP
jgi:taurine dioxygenase